MLGAEEEIAAYCRVAMPLLGNGMLSQAYCRVAMPLLGNGMLSQAYCRAAMGCWVLGMLNCVFEFSFLWF